MTDDSPLFVSYAQHGEDVVLWRALGDRGPGFYVDVGAFHPSDDSVTRALYERGWHGINIEPQADRIAAFESARPRDVNLAVAIGDRDGTAVLDMTDNPGWARLHDVPGDVADGPVKSVEVPIRRLDSLFEELDVRHVDVLKIDVEGAEPAVVRGLLGGPVRPLVCVVEGVAPATGRIAGDEAAALLVEAGYVHCLFDGLNHYLTIDSALEGLLSVPASPLDDYTTDLVSRLRIEREQHHMAMAQAEGQLADLQSERVGLAQTVADLTERMCHETTTNARIDRFARLLATPGWSEPWERDAGAESEQAGPSLIELATAEMDDETAVTLLYRSVLGRPPDPRGLALWRAELQSGETRLAVAERLASTEEAALRPAQQRRQVAEALADWRDLVLAREVGILPADDADPPPVIPTRDRFLVEALYEVGLGRAPDESEIRFHAGKLTDGATRDWLVRAFGRTPEVAVRLAPQTGRSVRDRVRHRLEWRRAEADFRARVLAAEALRFDQVHRSVARLNRDVRALGVDRRGSS